MTDATLEQRLTALSEDIAWPAADDLARRVTARLASAPPPAAGRRWWSGWPTARPVRRSLLAAIALVLALAAVAAATGLLLPGLRLVTLPPGATMPPAATPESVTRQPGGAGLGSALGLGVQTDLPGVAAIAGFEPVLPDDPTLGPPDEVWVALRRVNLLWRSTPELPATNVPGVGIVVTQFEGHVDDEWYEKILYVGATRVERVRVGGVTGFWVTGEPHALVYVDATGRAVEETRRVVGDVLIWRRDGLTFRIESALGRDATIALASSFHATP